MSRQSPLGAKIPATRTERRAIDVAVLCTTPLKLYLRLDEMHKLAQKHRRIRRQIEKYSNPYAHHVSNFMCPEGT